MFSSIIYKLICVFAIAFACAMAYKGILMCWNAWKKKAIVDKNAPQDPEEQSNIKPTVTSSPKTPVVDFNNPEALKKIIHNVLTVIDKDFTTMDKEDQKIMYHWDAPEKYKAVNTTYL